MIWSAPLQIILAIYILWQYLGVASFAGLTIMIFIIPANIICSNKNRRLKVKRLTFLDRRIKLMNEILNGIKVIKFFGWEIPFKKMIGQLRNQELKYFKQSEYMTLTTDFFWESASFFVSAASFTTYVLIDPKNTLEPQTVFVSLSLFEIVKFPLVVLPMVIAGIINVRSF